MINNSNSTKRSTDSKTKKDNKDDASSSTKNTKKASAIDSPAASKATANLTTLTAAKSNDSKTKKDNKDDASSSTKNKSNSILPLKLDELKKDKNDNEQQLSYYEKQVLKELKGIRKASKNILKTIKKFNN